MTPEDLADLHPLLYHLTSPEAWPGIERHGLLPPLRLLDLFGADADTRALVLGRRPASIPLSHPEHGAATVTDNLPLSIGALKRCLVGVTPDEWLGLLNERVFFWTSEKHLESLLGARANRGRARLVLQVATLPLARSHAERIEIAPINTGSTIHLPARRGRDTFSPLGARSYDAWRRLRRPGHLDRIKEVTVVGGVPDLAAYVVKRRLVPPRAR